MDYHAQIVELNFPSLNTFYRRRPISDLTFQNRTVNYMMTPDIVRQMVNSGHFTKTLDWRENGTDGRSYEAHTVKLNIDLQARQPEKPGALVVSPATGFSSNRPAPDKPFAPLAKSYTLKNSGDQTINFIVAGKAKWLDIDNKGGSLPPGGTAKVTASVNVAVAGKLTEDTYRDTVAFTNTTDGKGNTTRPAAITLAEEQTWRVTLTGQETDDMGGKAMYLKIKDAWKTKVINYGVRFDYKLAAQFTIMKKKGAWVYKDGTITTSGVTATPVFDQTVFFIHTWKCLNCSAVNNLKGTALRYAGRRIRLLERT